VTTIARVAMVHGAGTSKTSKTSKISKISRTLNTRKRGHFPLFNPVRKNPVRSVLCLRARGGGRRTRVAAL
jgi:predicted YcjX-like family ATPase